MTKWLSEAFGELSAILHTIELEGLITVDPSGPDGRVRVPRLVEAGRAGRAELGRLSDELAASVLEPLTRADEGAWSAP
jgi:DNA-binding MarR family transcriptional regulator